jgi:hypothetical protein
MMRRLVRLAVAGTAMLVLAAAGPADSPLNVPEPDGIWTGPQRGYTPATLSGATVIDIDALDALIARDKPILLDVSLADRRPAGFPDDRPWLPSHRSIPGAVWMANAGAAPLDPARETLFLQRVGELVLQGYTRVHWFPEGIEGWQERHPTTVIPEDPAWSARAGGAAQR